MSKKVLAVTLVMAMIICLLPAVTKDSVAGAYGGSADFRCDPNASDARVGGSNLGAVVWRSVRTDSANLASDFRKIVATRSGWDFLGWHAAKTGGTKIAPSNILGYANGTIYAHWAQFKFNTSGNGYVGCPGGSVSASVYSTAGHTWNATVTYLSGGTGWLSCSVSRPNSTRTDFTVSMSKNYGNYTRQAKVRITDQWNSKTYEFTISQQGLLDYINKQFKTSDKVYGNIYTKFLNLTSGEKVSYDKHYAAWFYNNGGCCTDSAMMDLLNRRLARNGALSTNYYFDVRDVIRGIAVTDLGKAAYDGVRVERRDPNNTEGNYPYYWSPKLVGVPSREARGGRERIEAEATQTTAFFINDFGDVSSTNTAHHARCTVSIERGAKTSDYLRNLLKTHAEGIFVYAKKSGGGAHAFVVVPGANEGEILFLDNGVAAAAGPVKRTEVNGYSVYTSNGKTESGVFSQIISIAYFK